MQSLEPIGALSDAILHQISPPVAGCHVVQQSRTVLQMGSSESQGVDACAGNLCWSEIRNFHYITTTVHDPAMKHFLLHLAENLVLGKNFVHTDLDDYHLFIDPDILAPFRCLTAMPLEGSTIAGILPGCPSLNRGGSEAEEKPAGFAYSEVHQWQF
ncbi:hypothetical protein CSKR_108960 [Clonorchis sinensis]|uniref:General transcription and DNA repair factor IIH subunit TFB5 n=1 Tax=Clonorchis sinensis TaxID=79923 RepID=A0A419PQE2_CLOSI|nr:hypothetical protein CSKR_108960 [Clonorchis sinensis]